MPTEHWTIGDVRITKVVESEGWRPIEVLHQMLPKASQAAIDEMDWLQPSYRQDDTMSVGIYAFLVEAGGKRVVVDTGVGNSKLRSLPNFHMLDTPFLDNFRKIWAPEDVDAVICTHLHVDHVGWNTQLVDGKWVPTFRNAAYHFVKSEYNHWREYADNDGNALGYTVIDGKTVFTDSVQPVVDAGLVTFIGSDATITPEISVIPSHGHTPGHVSVLVRSRGESAVITGDLMHSPCQIGQPGWSARYDFDRDASAATRRAFLERFADTPTIVIGTHFGTPSGGLVRRDGASFRLTPASCET
jgi:glyoxylase-like metal-dependent hydrolase (beta-lactamase superfamily II)